MDRGSEQGRQVEGVSGTEVAGRRAEEQVRDAGRPGGELSSSRLATATGAGDAWCMCGVRWSRCAQRTAGRPSGNRQLPIPARGRTTRGRPAGAPACRKGVVRRASDTAAESDSSSCAAPRATRIASQRRRARRPGAAPRIPCAVAQHYQDRHDDTITASAAAVRICWRPPRNRCGDEDQDRHEVQDPARLTCSARSPSRRTAQVEKNTWTTTTATKAHARKA